MDRLNARNLYRAGAAINFAHGLFAIFAPVQFLKFYSVPTSGETTEFLSVLLGMFGMLSIHNAGQMCQFAHTCTKAQNNITAMLSLCWALFHICGTFIPPFGMDLPAMEPSFALMAPRLFWILYSLFNFYMFSTAEEGGEQKAMRNEAPGLAYKILIVMWALMFVMNSYYAKEQVGLYFNKSFSNNTMNWGQRFSYTMGLFCFSILMNTLNLSTTANDNQKKVEFCTGMTWLLFIALNIALPAFADRFAKLGGQMNGQIFWGGVWAVPTYML